MLDCLSAHENFIHIVDYRPNVTVKFNHKPEQTLPMLVLEYAEKGDLFELISKGGRFSPEVSRYYIK